MDPVRISDIPIAKQLYEFIVNGKPERVQLFFDVKVLEPYQQLESYKIIRTDTSGRINKRGSWSLDFGISGEDDSMIHVPLDGFINRVPETERPHWLKHVISLPVSSNFIKGLIRSGCLDDGPIRDWVSKKTV